MKKDWIYKKFEDCIENVKYTTKIQSKDYMASGEYPIISQEEELVSGYWNKNEDVFSAPRPLVVFGDHTRVLKYIDFDFVLGADGVKILLPIEDLEAKFLYYFLKWYNIPNLGYSRHYKLLKEISIPIPPLSIQRSIVAELDLLHSVISKKKEQLRELDNLAQSLFYQMFGDPITNPKQWEVKKLGEIFEISSGGTPSKNIKDYWENGNIPWIGSNMCQNAVVYETDGKFITKKGLEKSSAKLLPIDSVLVALVGATIGKVALLKTESSTNQNIAFIKPHKDYNPTYVFYHLMNQYDLFMNIGNGDFKMATQGFIKSLSLMLAPLSLQQSFAAKIEAIEAQKQAVQQSIREIEALLAERMDNYFS